MLLYVLSVTVVLLRVVLLIAPLLYLTERGDSGIAETHQAQPHSSQGGLQSPTGHATRYGCISLFFFFLT